MPPPSPLPETLNVLVGRIAAGDRAALRTLYTALADIVCGEVRRALSDPAEVHAAVCSTFVEVWWLAGGHVDPDTDVMAWLHEIVRRRLADSRPLETPVADEITSAAFAAFWAHRAEVELAGLIELHPTP